MEGTPATSDDAAVTATTKPRAAARSDEPYTSTRYTPSAGQQPQQPHEMVDWEEPDLIVVPCPVCPCTYFSAVASLIVWTVINLALFAITPLACVSHGWLYWTNTVTVGGTGLVNGTFIAGATATLKTGWQKGSVTFINNNEHTSIKNLLAYNGTADASQALGIVCGSLSAVSLALCCVYIALFCAMFSPTNRTCWRFIHGFRPKWRFLIAMCLGILMFTFAFAFFGEAAEQWNDFWEDVTAAYRVSTPSSSTTTLWPTYSWFFFLFGSVTWPLIGFFAMFIPYPASPATRLGDAALSKA